MIKRPVPLTLTARRTPSKLTYWRTLLVDLVVIARTQTVHAAALRIAIEAERHHRNMAPITAWAAPDGWSSTYAKASP
jgi:hypothetical protein